MERFVMANFRREQYDRIIKNFDGFSKLEMRKMIVAAADRAASAGVTATKKGITREFTISGGTLDKVVKKYKYGSGLEMAIGVKIRDTMRPLSEFKFSPKKHSARPTVEVKRGNRRTLQGPRFVAHVHGRIAILERTSKKSYPVRALQGPSAVGMFRANESIHQMVWDIIFNKFEERVIHEIDYKLNKKG